MALSEIEPIGDTPKNKSTVPDAYAFPTPDTSFHITDTIWLSTGNF